MNGAAVSGCSRLLRMASNVFDALRIPTTPKSASSATDARPIAGHQVPLVDQRDGHHRALHDRVDLAGLGPAGPHSGLGGLAGGSETSDARDQHGAVELHLVVGQLLAEVGALHE